MLIHVFINICLNTTYIIIFSFGASADICYTDHKSSSLKGRRFKDMWVAMDLCNKKAHGGTVG